MRRPRKREGDPVPGVVGGARFPARQRPGVKQTAGLSVPGIHSARGRIPAVAGERACTPQTGAGLGRAGLRRPELEPRRRAAPSRRRPLAASPAGARGPRGGRAAVSSAAPLGGPYPLPRTSSAGLRASSGRPPSAAPGGCGLSAASGVRPSRAATVYLSRKLWKDGHAGACGAARLLEGPQVHRAGREPAVPFRCLRSGADTPGPGPEVLITEVCAPKVLYRSLRSKCPRLGCPRSRYPRSRCPGSRCLTYGCLTYPIDRCLRLMW